MSVLEARGIAVRRGHRLLLDDATLSLAPSEITAIVGPNGSGKSTLLRVLNGLWIPSAGTVLLDGQRVAAFSRREFACRVSYVPQDTRCDFAFTVEEVVAMGRHPHRGRFDRAGAADRRVVDASIERCDLGALRGRTLDTLSGGERQRVAIARCLATEPGVLLLDEPTAHLDLEHALALLELCRELAASGHAVAFATHDLGLAARYASRLVVVHAGRIVRTGHPAAALTTEACRDVFGVHAEVATTMTGRSTLVFSAFEGATP